MITKANLRLCTAALTWPCVVIILNLLFSEMLQGLQTLMYQSSPKPCSRQHASLCEGFGIFFIYNFSIFAKKFNYCCHIYTEICPLLSDLWVLFASFLSHHFNFLLWRQRLEQVTGAVAPLGFLFLTSVMTQGFALGALASPRPSHFSPHCLL